MTRRAILVLGMHRSGTSAVTGLLVRLGARAPKTLMRPNEHNPLGFWESDAFLAYHERLLRSAGTDWDEWTRVSFDDLDPATVAHFAEEWRGLLEQEFEDAPLIAVKDPRICRFVPFWLQNLAADGIEPSAVITLRSPLEVARSLEARDGLGMEHALMLWLRHLLDAEWETRSIARSVVSFQDLLLDWKPAARQMFQDIGLNWDEHSNAIDAEIASLLRPDLKHHDLGIEHLSAPAPLRDWVRETDAALTFLLTQDSQSARAALRTLDDVRKDVDRFSVAFGPMFGDMRRAHRRRTANLEHELRRHVASLEVELRQLRQHAVNVEAERECLQCVSRLEAELAQLRSHSARVEQESDRLAQELARTRSDSDAAIRFLSDRLAASETHAHSLLQSRSWRWTAPLRAAFRVWLKGSGRLSR